VGVYLSFKIRLLYIISQKIANHFGGTALECVAKAIVVVVLYKSMGL